MKKTWILLMLFVTILCFLLVYFRFKDSWNRENLGLKKYCNEEICVYTKYSIEELKDIPIISYTAKEEIKKYNLSLIFIDPEAKGNFTVTLLNLLLYLNKQKRAYAICKYYQPSCKIYTNSSIDRYIWIFYDNRSSLIDTNNFLLIFIEDIGNNDNIGIEIYKNQVFLYGNNNTIVKVLDKFLLYWYDFIDN